MVWWCVLLYVCFVVMCKLLVKFRVIVNVWVLCVLGEFFKLELVCLGDMLFIGD